MGPGRLVFQGRQSDGRRHDAECETCARFREGLRGAFSLPAPGATDAGGFDFVGPGYAGAPAECLAEMYGELCDDVYRRWVGGFGASGRWEDRLDAAAEAGIDCLEIVPGARDIVGAAIASGDPRIAQSRSLLRKRLTALIAREYDGELDGFPELHFEFLLGAISRTVAEGLSAGEPVRRVRERVRTAIALLEPAAA